MRSKLLTTLSATMLASGVNISMAQNVQPDQDQAQSHRQRMQDREQRLPPIGRQSTADERERMQTQDTSNAPTAADVIRECKGMTRHAKEHCVKMGAPATGRSEDRRENQ